jgi:hypothetical protein
LNSDQPSTSTINTLVSRIPPGTGTAVTVAIALSAHAVLHIPALATVILAIALLRRRAVVSGLGVVFGMLTAIFGTFYVVVKGKDPSAYFPGALARITCALGLPVAPEALAGFADDVQPAVAPVPQPARPELSVLPPATNTARRVEETIFWQTAHAQMPSRVQPNAKGRHRRQATPPVSISPAPGTGTGIDHPAEVQQPVPTAA